MAERSEAVLSWSRIATFLASFISSIYLAGVLGIGALVVTIDWNALDCFDGTEPTCDQPARHGLGLVQASSWCFAALGSVALVGAFAVALRARRLSHLGVASGLCITAAVAGAVLQARL